MKIILLVLIGGYLLASLLLYLLQEKFIFQGVSLEDDYQYEFNLPFEEINLNMADGGKINTLLFTTPDSKGLILYYHGNAGNLAGWGELSTTFTSLGYDFAIMDYRGYGKSRGKRTPANLMTDASEFYKYYKNLYAEDKIVLYGRSLGTGLAAFIASTNEPSKLILETPYNNFTAVIQSHVPIYPAGPALKYKIDTQKYMRNVTCPVYIFHGTEDRIVPFRLGMKLYNGLKPGTAQLFIIEGGSHNDLGSFAEYQEGLRTVL